MILMRGNRCVSRKVLLKIIFGVVPCKMYTLQLCFVKDINVLISKEPDIKPLAKVNPCARLCVLPE